MNRYEQERAWKNDLKETHSCSLGKINKVINTINK
jgi:hypothetical protein